MSDHRIHAVYCRCARCALPNPAAGCISPALRGLLTGLKFVAALGAVIAATALITRVASNTILF